MTTIRFRRAVMLAALAAAACSAVVGCSVQPWVKPYERDHLADPIMSFDPNPVSSSYTDHVYEAREGARGASGSARRRLRLQLRCSWRAVS